MTRLNKTTLSTIQFRGLDEAISDFNNSSRQLRNLYNLLARNHAYVSLGFAQKRSLGPLDPQQARGSNANPSIAKPFLPSLKTSYGMRRNTAVHVNPSRNYVADPAAWKIPVRRITSDYFNGWRVVNVRRGIWRMENRSREAYFIEFGINHKSTGLRDSAGNRVRIRRPILKMAVLDTLKVINSAHMDTSALGQLLAGKYGHSSRTGSYGFQMGAQDAGFRSALAGSWINAAQGQK